MAPIVERIAEIPNLELGEGPHWDSETQCLYLVDIFKKSLHKYVPSTGHHAQITFDKPTSIIIPVRGKTDQFIVTLERDLVLVTWDGVSEKPSKVEKITDVDGNTENRINDGKCDPSGRLWMGTMGPEHVIGHYLEGRGTLFSYSSGKLTPHISNIGISNGLAWNTQLKKMYYIDSLAYRVDAFDYEHTTGVITNRTTVFDFKVNGIDGLPDGMTIDVDGNLWVAVFNGYKVIKIDPRKPNTLLETVELPAKQVTSVAWGGENLDILYVTSGSFAVDGLELLPPNHGATFKVTGLGTKGLPATDFVL